MHLSAGSITPMWAVCGAVGTGLSWALAAPIARMRHVRGKEIAIATLAVVVVQAIDFPVLPGVSAHLLGGFAVAMLLGSAWGLYVMSLVLAIQAVLFHDGGILAYGVNVLTLGVIACLVVRPLLIDAERVCTQRLRVGVLAFVSAVASAVTCSAMLGTGSGFDGAWIAQAATLIGSHCVLGLVEAAATVGIVMLLQSHVLRTHDLRRLT